MAHESSSDHYSNDSSERPEKRNSNQCEESLDMQSIFKNLRNACTTTDPRALPTGDLRAMIQRVDNETKTLKRKLDDDDREGDNFPLTKATRIKRLERSSKVLKHENQVLVKDIEEATKKAVEATKVLGRIDRRDAKHTARFKDLETRSGVHDSSLERMRERADHMEAAHRDLGAKVKSISSNTGTQSRDILRFSNWLSTLQAKVDNLEEEKKQLESKHSKNLHVMQAKIDELESQRTKTDAVLQDVGDILKHLIARK